jgi:hypothetical protein
VVHMAAARGSSTVLDEREHHVVDAARQATQEERAVVDDGAARIVEHHGTDDAYHQHVVDPLDLRQRPEGQDMVKVDGDDDTVAEYLHVAFCGVYRVQQRAGHPVEGEDNGDGVAGRMQDKVAPFELERHEDQPVHQPPMVPRCTAYSA